MKEFLLAVLALVLLAGLGVGAQIDPGVDEIIVNDDGELIELFGIDAWQSDTVHFCDPVALRNGTAIIGGMKPAGS